ncbi:glycine betaine ABC transporter substrate-binding protein [Candidatus Poriferisodalis sp.]|uniref:glycine betaine ABC transporter substrate-binding protein n=1 Tax=Candidatus Poriferisodalis sp. TaxID=3101277 RepID=UPI003B0196BA
MSCTAGEDPVASCGGLAPSAAGPARWRRLGALAAVAVLGWSCATDDAAPGSAATHQGVVPATAAMVGPAPSAPAATAATEPAVPVVLRPGEGVQVRAAGGPRPGSGFVGEVYRQMLGELGYSVSEPRDLVVPGSSVAYLYLAEGEFDVWLDGRYPYDEVWLDGQRFDGSRVGDHVMALGQGHPVDAWMGWLISKDFADEHGVYTLDALNDDPAAVAAFDVADAVPGNGKADILTLPEGVLSGDVHAAQVAFSGWDRIALVRLGSEEFFALDERFEEAASRGVPMIAVASSPSELVAKLRPGHEVYWLGVEGFLDDSNPLGHPDGELFSQWTRGIDGTGGHGSLGPDECPSAAADPQGLCPLGWVASTRTVAASTEFAASNPAAAVLLDAVFVSAADVSQALVREAQGTDPAALASEWIAANRASVDEWLTAARTAASGG